MARCDANLQLIRDKVAIAAIACTTSEDTQFFTEPCVRISHQKMVAGFHGSRRSAIELPGGVNDSSCDEKVDYSCLGALCSGDGAGFLREQFLR